MALEEEVNQRIGELVESHRVVLFMKGTRHFPQCGFSATVTQILDGLVKDYQTVNVLKDPDVRQGIKGFSDWPTIPQLYVEGKFVGGCDIVREMYLAGELQELLGVEEDVDAPELTLTEAAASAIRAATEGHEGSLRLEVSPRFEYELSMDEPRKGDFKVESLGLVVLVDRDSAKRSSGVSIDYSDQSGGGFKIDNPNEPPRVQPLSPAELKQWMDEGKAFRLYDVRPSEERALASIEGSLLLDEQAMEELQGLPKDSVLVFQCHHGMRSAGAAQQLLEQGFSKVYNLDGGIAAWSAQVDPQVPSY